MGQREGFDQTDLPRLLPSTITNSYYNVGNCGDSSLPIAGPQSNPLVSKIAS